eukprot:TRINITY_DN15120_c1_g3_i1.p1 TRINITY_DN15120_c1_g3~~TRINITY_DN15120_c1_g3_i1.p1  ORF type:complete len:413 (-),score=91.28 TRINITY_DN15120_c1_g3_i1:194-1324(-)
MSVEAAHSPNQVRQGSLLPPRPVVPAAQADECRQALLASLNEAERNTDPSEVNAGLTELRAHTGAARQSAAELSALLTLKAPPLQRRATRLAGDIEGLGAETAQITAATVKCLEELKNREEALRVHLVDNRREVGKEVEAQLQRRDQLMTEVSTLEARIASDTLTASSSQNGPTWAAAQAERRAALTARIERAVARQAQVAELSKTSVARSRARLQELQQARAKAALDSCLPTSAEKPEIPVGSSQTWRSRFEALITKHRGMVSALIAGTEDENTALLSEALKAAKDSLAEANKGPSALPKLVTSALRSVKGLADAERRRTALLVTRWRELQGLQGDIRATIAPIQSFSPPRAVDWVLDGGGGSSTTEMHVARSAR